MAWVRWANQPEEHLDRGRLAGAIRAEEAEDLARLDAERQSLDRHSPTRELLAQIMGLDRGDGGRAGSLAAGYVAAGEAGIDQPTPRRLSDRQRTALAIRVRSSAVRVPATA